MFDFSFERTYGIVLRQWYNLKRSYDRLSEVLYWPMIDLVVWGFTSAYFQSEIIGQPLFIQSILAGVTFWFIFWIGANSVGTSTLMELWDRNLMNILVSPLSYLEWMVGNIFMAVIRSFISFGFTIILALVLYNTSLFSFVFKFIPHTILLIMASWWVAFFVVGTILRFGTKIQTVAWALPGLISPFSAVYYPVDSLPPVAKAITLAVPTSYIFESIREYINFGVFTTDQLWMSFVLNLIYLVLAVWFLKSSINKAREKGLGSLY